MVLLFFYITYFGLLWAGRKRRNLVLLSCTLVLLLLFFALPAMKIGFWEVMSSIIPHVLVIFLAVIFRKFSDSKRLENEKQALKIQNVQSELDYLKMQVSPHFLFNTLNNIDYLISVDAEKASGAISKLGSILRYMIYETRSETISLAKELKNIEDYIELVRIRTSGENFLNYHISGSVGHLKIAPMLFQPLVENAYKHAARKDGENIIDIVTKIDGKKVCFVVENEYNAMIKISSDEGGAGLASLKRRLELIYPNRHNFVIEKSGNKYRVELTIELDEY
jgi:LytS/YehU family sensor histidine kinase